MSYSVAVSRQPAGLLAPKGRAFTLGTAPSPHVHQQRTLPEPVACLGPLGASARSCAVGRCCPDGLRGSCVTLL